MLLASMPPPGYSVGLNLNLEFNIMPVIKVNSSDYSRFSHVGLHVGIVESAEGCLQVALDGSITLSVLLQNEGHVKATQAFLAGGIINECRDPREVLQRPDVANDALIALQYVFLLVSCFDWHCCDLMQRLWKFQIWPSSLMIS